MKKFGFSLCFILLCFIFSSCSFKLQGYRVYYHTYDDNVIKGEYVYPPATTTPIEASREGYTFLGWYLDEEYSTLMDFSKKIDKRYDVYAKWSNNLYTVSFDLEGGTMDTNSIIVTYDMPYGNLPIPTKDGSIFLGWKGPNGEEITKDTIVKTSENHTLYAVWSNEEHMAFADGRNLDAEYRNVLSGSVTKLPVLPVKGALYQSTITWLTDYTLVSINSETGVLTIDSSLLGKEITLTGLLVNGNEVYYTVFTFTYNK